MLLMLTASVKSQCGCFRDGLTAIRGTMICALIVVLLDVLIGGSYLFATLICPIWFLVAVFRAIIPPPSLGVAVARVMIPLVTLLLVIANYSLQQRIAMANAARVIQACEQYRKAGGAYPQRLDNLVPGYLSSIPKAKCCFAFNEFSYLASAGHILVWCECPPFGRRVYNFETGNWKYLD
jgi:hypothetical protein